MKLFQAYSAAIKYRLVSNQEMQPFIEAHHAGDSAALQALTDKLIEENDPRGDILQRELGLTKHPQKNPWNVFYQNIDDNPYINTDSIKVVSGDPFYPEGKSTIYIEPRASRRGGKAEAFRLHFSHYTSPQKGESSGQKWIHAGGFFTPDEVHTIADKFDPEQAQQIHNLVNKHFPPK